MVLTGKPFIFHLMLLVTSLILPLKAHAADLGFRDFKLGMPKDAAIAIAKPLTSEIHENLLYFDDIIKGHEQL